MKPERAAIDCTIDEAKLLSCPLTPCEAGVGRNASGMLKQYDKTAKRRPSIIDRTKMEEIDELLDRMVEMLEEWKPKKKPSIRIVKPKGPKPKRLKPKHKAVTTKPKDKKLKPRIKPLSKTLRAELQRRAKQASKIDLALIDLAFQNLDGAVDDRPEVDGAEV